MVCFDCSTASIILLVFCIVKSICQPQSRNVSLLKLNPVKPLLKRPFYNIAHMVNSLNEIDLFLEKGANAIESNVYFAPNATPVFTYHGYPCDCFRHCDEKERISVFLNRVRELTTLNSARYNPRLLLLFMDIKLVRISHNARALAGQNLATVLMRNLYQHTEASNLTSGSNIRTLISINHVFDYDFILGFEHEFEIRNKSWIFRDFIGWDIGFNDPIFAIESLWKRIESVHNIWQGDGRSNCVSPFYNLARLSTIIKRRDNPSLFAIKNYIRKAYQWTVDLTVNIRTALRSNVDAIITNHPERVINVLREREFSTSYRIAQLSDSPWERVVTKIPKQGVISNPAFQPSTMSLKLVNGAGDMLDSFTRYLADILINRSPLRYLYLSTYSTTVVNHQKHHYLQDVATETYSAEHMPSKTAMTPTPTTSTNFNMTSSLTVNPDNSTSPSMSSLLNNLLASSYHHLTSISRWLY